MDFGRSFPTRLIGLNRTTPEPAPQVFPRWARSRVAETHCIFGGKRLLTVAFDCADIWPLKVRANFGRIRTEIGHSPLAKKSPNRAKLDQRRQHCAQTWRHRDVGDIEASSAQVAQLWWKFGPSGPNLVESAKLTASSPKPFPPHLNARSHVTPIALPGCGAAVSNRPDT